jgi:cytoskeletal protein RodZ
MPNSSVRTVVLFSIIALVLAGVAVGGVRLIKARNDSYASQGKVAQTDNKQQPAQHKADTSKPVATDQKDANSSTKQSQKQNTDSSKNTAAVPPVTNSTPTPTPAPATNDKKDMPAAAVPQPPAQNHSNLPATSGFALSEVLPTLALMALAGFFGSKLLRARADYRRYIGS